MTTHNTSNLRRFAIININASAWGQCDWFAPHVNRTGLWVRSNGDTYHSAELVPCRTFSIGMIASARLSDSVDARNMVLRVIRSLQAATHTPTVLGDDDAPSLSQATTNSAYAEPDYWHGMPSD